MRRFFMGMAIASLTAGAPMTAFGGDREIADAIITQLKQQQSTGSLKGFDINLSVEEGRVIVDGAVANQGQLDSILRVASTTAGVKEVVNNVKVQQSSLPQAAPAPATEQVVVPASANDDAPALMTLPESEEPTVRAEDANITSEVLTRLGSAQKNGQLRNFDIDVSTIEGEVWVRGHVASPDQKSMVLGTVQRVPGVVRVVDEVSVGQTVRPVSGMQQAPSAMPVVGSGAPRAFAPSTLVNGSVPAAPVGYGAAAPVPMQGGPSYGGGVPRYDQPNMPNYAWPSYAAYPNYSAVTYPKQYSASAWPYIGPFYPYPQVPLGWRKVALEWDDGLWYLDFTHK
ncbi:periplasmic protein [Pirellula sp. SH-Sr6A]|uniref:BON domain-containing protein n=1 Tax=Pirellula sp. SH-Sr6A TaxID=1632865 RepID=UPI00078EAC93|nr:BON domain-containing protein [Pirellula sp. SH-Sr6A]AMV33643.1 periplasmic protein [Pirellula sp. SH-Sr6A]